MIVNDKPKCLNHMPKCSYHIPEFSYHMPQIVTLIIPNKIPSFHYFIANFLHLNLGFSPNVLYFQGYFGLFIFNMLIFNFDLVHLSNMLVIVI
jgi:hypothetical protein